MIEFLKSDLEIGNKIKLHLTSGKEIVGMILEIGTNHLLIKNQEGTITRIFEVLIGGWDIIIENDFKSTHSEEINSLNINSISESRADIINSELKEDNSSEINSLKNEEILDNDKKEDQESNEGLKNNIIEDKTIIEKGEKKIGLKIVGKIPLEELETRKNKIQLGNTYRLREISSNYNIPGSIIAQMVQNLGIKIDLQNPNFRIDQKTFDLIKSQVLKYKDNNAVKSDITSNQEIGLKLTSFSDLSILKEKIEIDISKQMLPANAQIKRYFFQKEKRYGFLTDFEGLDYYFKYSEVKDENLLKKLDDFGSENIQVICKLDKFEDKLIAKSIYLTQSVNYFQERAEKYFESEKLDEAVELTNLILFHFPQYSRTIEIKKKIEYQLKRRSKIDYNENNLYSSSNYQNKARNAQRVKEKYFQLVEKNDKYSEKAVKQLALLLSGEGNYDEAIELVRKNFFKIKSSDPNSFIAYFYEAKKDYTVAINFLKKIKSKSPNDKIKIAKRLALCYVGVGEYLIAEEQINFVLTKNPKDDVANKLKKVVQVAKEKGSAEDIDSIFEEAEIQARTGGLSKFLISKLKNCEFSGVPRSEIEKEKFNSKTLSDLEIYIKTIKEGRPRERAEAYLSQAKIEQIVDSENTSGINSALAKYCTSIASSWAADGKQIDTYRFFILEAASLEPDKYENISRYIPLFLHSFSQPIMTLKSKMNQSLTIAMEEIIPLNKSNSLWYGVLDMLLVNSSFSTKYLTLLYNNENYRIISIKFLQSFLNEKIHFDLPSKTFLDFWTSARDKFKREKDIFNVKLSAILKSNTLESLVESYINIKQSLPEWIGQFDKSRFDSLNDIIETITDFNQQHSFEDKERYFQIIIGQISHIKEDIEESPTNIGYNSIIPILDFTHILMSEIYNVVIESSKPKLNVQVYGEGSKDEKSDVLNIQFAVSNKKGSAPVSFFKLVILNDENIEFIEENNILLQTLKGGDEQILRLKVRVKNEILEQGAASIKIEYSYSIRGNNKEYYQQDELSLRFYTSADFEKIDNVFATTADSGPVQDTSMFFGRQEFISNIKESIVNSKSKCVIIYGQKRSGKSSVLHHLRESLNNTPETFCISFSLGEIIEDLSPKTFYYTILSEIEDTLYAYQNDNNVPIYTAPEYKELEDAPTLLFNNQLKLLNREFQKFSGWENKKLVLLIDEFTYIYTAIKKEQLSDQFMKTWKSFLEKGFFNSVLIGQDIMPKFKADYPNEFGVTEDKRLSYLNKSDAVSLIEKPIWDKKRDRTRFLGKATDLILDYTSSNPYYVQIFCARLVDYMNENKAISVTEADVHDVANSFIKGEQALTADKFDNLITAGDADLDAFNANDVLSALKKIAIASKNLDSCPRDAINLGEPDYEEKILKDLKDREVLSIPQPGFFKINVRLFKEWLLIN
jgi:hypothetical protein